MKKFLTMLLALSVVFTYTFGAAGSVFAAASSKYSVDDQKTLLANAYNAAIAEAAGYNYDFDSHLYTGTTADNDLTMVAVSADAVKAGIAAAYDAVLADITAASTTSIETKVKDATKGDYNATLNNTTTSTDFVAVKKYLLGAAEIGGDQEDVVLDKAFADFKAYLTAIVDGVDIKDYTSTVQTTKYTAKDGAQYDTAAKAAAADIAYAKAVINHAKFKDSTLGSSADDEADWTVNTYDALYDAVICAENATGSDIRVIKVVTNEDDAIHANYVTSLTYKLFAKDGDRAYATTKSEAAEEANEGVKKASAKAALLAAITTFENANTLKSAAQAQLDAYNEAMTYLIENTTGYATTYKVISVKATGVDATDDGKDNAVDYVKLSDAAKAAIADVDTLKAAVVARGSNWDDAEAAKALKAQLIAIYGGNAAAIFNDDGKGGSLYAVISNDLTEGVKASYKVDYSDIEAAAYDSKIVTTAYNGKAYAYKKKAYYAKEWEAVKAILDTYNASVDAAKVVDDITGTEGAQAVRDAALAKVAEADDVYSVVDNATSTYSALQAYAGLAFRNAKAADTTLAKIYVSFGDVADEITDATGAGLTDSKVYLWAIDKGARTANEVAALYADACKVIDAYKTLNDVKADAAAVQAAIAALPATATLADKAAVVAAYDAYVALTADAKNYVTNYTVLKVAIAAVEKAEAYDVKAKIDALPDEAKVAVTDKAAIEAARDAYNDYSNTTAYDTKSAYAALAKLTLSPAGYDFGTALTNVQTAAKKAIDDAFAVLNNKYIADKLTAEDDAAVKALQADIKAYVAEYNNTPTFGIENDVAKIAAVVAKAVAAAEEEKKAEEEKAALETKLAVKDSKAKFASSKSYKNSIKLTFNKPAVGVDGYVVYMATKKNGLYKKVATVKTNTYTKKNLKKGTSYYFKVKAYKVVGEEKVYTQTSGKLCKKTTK